MRLLLASLIAGTIVSGGVAPLAFAQSYQAPTAPPPPAAPPAAAVQTPGQAPAPAPAPAPAAPPAPPAPPPAPTDPAAVDLIDVLQSVCVPAVEGGSLDSLARSHGFRRSGENYVLKGRGFQFTLLAPGSNPNQCHIDMIHPVYPEAPAAALVVALHNWAAVERSWTVYRNDKNIESGQELTTRSWEHDDPGKHEAMFITTYRQGNGSPMKGNADTSTMVYSETKT